MNNGILAKLMHAFCLMQFGIYLHDFGHFSVFQGAYLQSVITTKSKSLLILFSNLVKPFLSTTNYRFISRIWRFCAWLLWLPSNGSKPLVKRHRIRIVRAFLPFWLSSKYIWPCLLWYQWSVLSSVWRHA